MERTDPGTTSQSESWNGARAGRVELLPVPATPLVGRQQDLDLARQQLQRANIRLLTMAGPAGVGKTHLALRLAADVAADFGDGVVFVPCASINDPALLLPAIGRAVGLRDAAELTLLRIDAAIRPRHLLLLLDNLEHLLDAAPDIAGLISACPRLTVLATSRSPLRLRDEHLFPVAPLALPSPGATTADVIGSPAVTLFVDRARAAEPGFTITEPNVEAIASICARLDGLPLAIELASAQVRLLSPHAILDRLDRRLPLLTTGPRDAPLRQRTLHAAIGWSHDLLDTEDQAIFRRLAVFVGSFGFDDAATVGAMATSNDRDGTDDPPDPSQLEPAVQRVASLVDKSLVRRDEGFAAEPRLAMLETIRAFALDRLRESGEEHETRRRHALLFLELAERAALEIEGPRQAGWYERLEIEHDNLRAALRWATSDTGDPALGLRLAVALGRFWLKRGYLAEGRDWFDRALQATPTDAIPDSAWSAIRAKALNQLGGLLFSVGETERSLDLVEESVAIRRRTGDRRGLTASLNNLGVQAKTRGEYARAIALHEEGLATASALGEERITAVARINLGDAVAMSGDRRRAELLLREALTLVRSANDPDLTALGWFYLGRLARASDDLATARSFLEQALAAYQSAGSQGGAGCALRDLARVTADQGDARQAAAQYAEALAILHAQHDWPELVECFDGIAELDIDRVTLDRVRLLGVTAAMRDSMGARRSPSDEPRLANVLTRLRGSAGGRFGAEWEIGRGLSLDGAVETAMVIVSSAAGADAGSQTGQSRRSLPEPYGLSGRELEVLKLVAAGLTNAEVAERLYLSPRTIDAHLRRIYPKMEVSSHGAAIRRAVEDGVV